MSCDQAIDAGVPKDCDAIKGAVGVEKDLILVNFDEFDGKSTLDAANIEADDTNGNEGGLSAIKLLTGAVQYVFEGTDYSVKPTVNGELREDGDTWYLHAIGFMAYSKTSVTRTTLEKLGRSRVIAIVVDRSTGLYELFGAEHGLKISELTREYVGNQNGNFYTASIATPDVAAVRESNLGYLSSLIETAA